MIRSEVSALIQIIEGCDVRDRIKNAAKRFEDLAIDIESLAVEERDSDKAMQRALLSVVYRIRHENKNLLALLDAEVA